MSVIALLSWSLNASAFGSIKPALRNSTCFSRLLAMRWDTALSACGRLGPIAVFVVIENRVFLCAARLGRLTPLSTAFPLMSNFDMQV